MSGGWFLGCARPLIGVVHLAALPGAPRHEGGMEAVLAAAVRDATALRDAGVDALVVENFGDAPFWKDDVPPVTVAALTTAALVVSGVAPELPLGINCLRNDGLAAVSIAATVGAAFVRVNVLTGAMLTDQGVIEGRAAEVARLRATLAPGLIVATDVLVKHAVPLAPVDPASCARDAVERGGADALIVTGTHTGGAVDVARLRAVRAGAGGRPVLLGSGVCTDNVSELLPHADGAIVASALEEDGRGGRPVDPARAAAFVAAYRAVRDAS